MTDDQNTLAIMVASIYAGRMTSYWSTSSHKTEESFRQYRQKMIEVSITEAVMICEAVQRDFPA